MRFHSKVFRVLYRTSFFSITESVPKTIGQPVSNLATVEKIDSTDKTVCGFVEQELFEHDSNKLRLDRCVPRTVE